MPSSLISPEGNPEPVHVLAEVDLQPSNKDAKVPKLALVMDTLPAPSLHSTLVPPKKPSENAGRQGSVVVS